MEITRRENRSKLGKKRGAPIATQSFLIRMKSKDREAYPVLLKGEIFRAPVFESGISGKNPDVLLKKDKTGKKETFDAPKAAEKQNGRNLGLK